jgi:hypothetical protein
MQSCTTQYHFAAAGTGTFVAAAAAVAAVADVDRIAFADVLD